MKTSLHRIAILCAMLICSGQLVQAQFQFNNGNTKLITTNFKSGCSVAVADWNNDGLDDIIRLEQGYEAFVEIQKTGNQFETRSFGVMAGSSAWSMCVADFDKNGYLDIVGGWNGSCKVMMMNNTGTAGTIVTLPGSNFFLQNMTAIDADNDGWIDLFTCDDNGESTIYRNDGAGNLSASPIIDFDVTSTDDSGNYGSVWTDFDNDGDVDLYIAKCRQGVNSPTDGRRINVMFLNNGDGSFTESAAEYNIAIGWQSWTASFGDINNDGDLDLMLTNHDYQSQILENDGTGHYTDITATTGFDISNMTPIQSGFEDLDNDGFIDILITGSTQRIFHNNGNNTFSEVLGLFDSNDIGSFAFGDLDHDGKIDIYSSYNTIYTNPGSTDDVIWFNRTNNENHFITFNLQGVQSNITAIGARVTLYGSWGIQVREVRAGESYGTVSTSKLHFGLGNATSIDSAVVHFPSGIEQTIIDPEIDQFITLIEGECIAPFALITSSGTNVICPGQSLTLSAPEGLIYNWSNGEVTQSVAITEAGEYNVALSETGNNCISVSQTINIELTPDETPAIAALGETFFCNGGVVTLEAPEGLNGYSWSNGTVGTNTTTVDQSGSYTLTIQGACATYTSDPINVVELSPAMPTADDVVLPLPGSTTLTAVGDSIQWYDAPGGNLLGAGNSFVTPTVTTTATYYAVNVGAYGGGVFEGGIITPLSTNQFGATSTNSRVYFNVATASTLRSFTVYTDTPGQRKIDLWSSTNVLLNSVTPTLVSGANVITLDFDLPVGTGYYLLTDAAYNQTLLTQNSPRLQRENNATAVVYPYVINGLVSITSNQYGNQYYFYFYDWKVEEAPTYCSSDAHAVSVTVDNSTSIDQNTLTASVSVSPNPADMFLNVNTSIKNSRVSLMDATGRVVKEQNIDLNGTIAVNEFKAGIYLLRVASASSSTVIRVVIQ